MADAPTEDIGMTEPPRGREPRALRSKAVEVSGVIASAVRLTWAASKSRSLLIIAVQLAASLSLLAQVLLIDAVLTAVLDVARFGGSARAALLPIAILAALTVATAFATTLSDLQQRVLGEFVSREVWRRLLDVGASIDLATYEDPDFYDEAERVRAGAVGHTQLVVQGLALLVGDTLGVLGAAAGVLWLAPSLLPFLLLSGVPIFLTSRLAGRREFDFAVEQSPRSRARDYLQSVLMRREEAAEVRAFSLAPTLRGRWESNYAGFLAALRHHVSHRLRLALLGNLAAAVLIAAALVMAVVLVSRDALSVSSAGAALVAVRLLGNRVGGATLGMSTIFESSLFLRDLDHFLSRTAGPRSDHMRATAPERFTRLTASEVTFTYPGAPRPSLSDVSVEIRAGEVVALVGENGSGKSTLAKILANLYVPDKGCVRWDGNDLRSFAPDSVRRRIAVLFQNFVRYQLAARDNIALGRADEDVDLQSIRQAAGRADADEFLSALPSGYDTLLSKEYSGGTDLSLGQWQRLALARAFLRDAPFIILDEPSSSLDARAEHDLFDRMRSLAAGRTVLLISHRFSTVRSADRIYVLAHGQVVEHGDHDTLMGLGGLYADLFHLQADSYLAENEE